MSSSRVEDVNPPSWRKLWAALTKIPVGIENPEEALRARLTTIILLASIPIVLGTMVVLTLSLQAMSSPFVSRSVRVGSVSVGSYEELDEPEDRQDD